MTKKYNRDIPLPSSNDLFGGPGDRQRSTTDNTSVNSNQGVKINAMFGKDRPENRISRPIHRFNSAFKQAYNLLSPQSMAAKAIKPKKKK
jgi:hypothetical protein